MRQDWTFQTNTPFTLSKKPDLFWKGEEGKDVFIAPEQGNWGSNYVYEYSQRGTKNMQNSNNLG